MLRAVGNLLLGVLALLAKAVLLGLRALLGLMQRSRAFALVFALAVVLVAGSAVDTALNWGKIYGGVRVGAVDVGGKTPEEAQAALQEAYGPRLEAASVVMFSSEEAAQSLRAMEDQAAADAVAEQLSLEEARENKQLWLVAPDDLGATLPVEDMAASAMAVGRENGGVGARLLTMFGGWDLDPRVAFDANQFEALAAEADVVIGNPRVDYGIVIENGVARVTEGHDGSMVNRDWLAAQLSSAMLDENSADASFVAVTEYAPLRITAEAAQRTCDEVNRALSGGASFTYNGTTWQVGAETLGLWTVAQVEGGEGAWQLAPRIDVEHARSELLASALEASTGDPVAVTFTMEGDEPYVHTADKATIPLTAEAVSALDESLYGPFRENGGQGASAPHIEVASGTAAQTMTFDEALAAGVIGPISSYTTEFVSSAANENRNSNIRLGAQLLNNSIVAANGGEWSFLETTGEFTEDKGFLAAGVISEGEFAEDFGGGICQTATTTFLAVYESGFPVVRRHAHSLYMASYPDGRDAAVAWPDLDLRWKNDSTSDVIMRTSSTDTSVTVELYGVNPGYQVSTEVGPWQPGAEYETVEKVDESLAPGASYVKTRGKDGSGITVVRTVSSSAGDVLRSDTFNSNYRAVNEVVVKGPDA